MLRRRMLRRGDWEEMEYGVPVDESLRVSEGDFNFLFDLLSMNTSFLCPGDLDMFGYSKDYAIKFADLFGDDGS